MKISKTDCLRTPKSDGFYIPGEFEPHEGTLMIWPWRPGSWNYGLKFARHVKAIGFWGSKTIGF